MPFKGRRTYARKLKVSASKKQKATAVEQVKVKNIKKIVKSVMKKQVELKYAVQETTANNVQVAGSGLLYDGVTNLRGWCSGASIGAGIIPSIPPGSGEGSRIGNQIIPKTLRLKYFLQALPTTDSVTGALNTNPYKGMPFRVRVLVFRHRYANDDYSQADLLNLGNSNISFGSGIDNFFRPYNKDEYIIVHSKSYKMAAIKHMAGASLETVTTENVPNGSMSFIYHSCTIPLPKVLRYNDGVNVATNQAYFMAVAVCNEDGSIITAGTHRRLQLNAETGLSYYDA